MTFLNTQPLDTEGMEVVELRYDHHGGGVYILSEESRDSIPESLLEGVGYVYHNNYVHSFQLSVVCDLENLKSVGYTYLWHETMRKPNTHTKFYIQRV